MKQGKVEVMGKHFAKALLVVSLLGATPALADCLADLREWQAAGITAQGYRNQHNKMCQ